MGVMAVEEHYKYNFIRKTVDLYSTIKKLCFFFVAQPNITNVKNERSEVTAIGEFKFLTLHIEESSVGLNTFLRC